MAGPASPVHAGEDLPDPPALVLGQRPRLFEQDPVAHLTRIGLVVSFEPLRPRDDPLVAGMAVHALDDHHARLGHLVAHHHAFLRLGLAHVDRLLSARVRHRALAQDSLGPREVPLGLLYPRRILGHAHRELESEVEQLFRQLLDLLLQLFAVHLPPARRFHDVRKLCWAVMSIRLVSFMVALLENARTGHELGLDADLLRGEPETLARRRLIHAFHLVHDASRLDHRDPELRVALALAHPRLRRFLRHRLVREDADEDLAPALDAAGEGDAGRLDLAIGHPPRLEGLEPEVPEGEGGAALGLALHAAALGLAILDALGHQHDVLGLRGRALGGKDLALEDPYLDADGAIGGVRLGEAVVDLGADGVERHPAVAIPFAACDLRPAQTTRAGDPDAVGAQAEGRGDGLLHGPAEGDALLQLQGHVLRDQLRVELRMDHLFDIEVDLFRRTHLDLVLELLHLGALAPDDDARPRGEDRDAGPVGRALDIDARDPRVVQRGLDEPADLDVLVQETRIALGGEPPRAPRARGAQPEPDRMCLLPHGYLWAAREGRAVSSESSIVRWLVRCLMKKARPMARGETRFIEGPPSAVALTTRRSSRSLTWWLCSALAMAERSTFSMRRAAALGVNCSTARASPADLPRMCSRTRRALEAGTRT